MGTATNDDDGATAAPSATRTSTLRFTAAHPIASRSTWFVSDKTAPRRRRPSDIVRLGLGAIAFGLFGWAAASEADVDTWALETFADMPDWIRSIAWFLYGASVLTAIVIGVASAFAGIGRGVVRDLASALGLAFVLAILGSRAANGDWPVVLPEFFSREGIPPYPTLRISVVVTITLILAPYLSSSIRRVLRWAAGAAVVAPVLLTLTTITGVFGGLALSLAVVAAVRLAFGSPEGLPSVGRLNDTLAGVGIPVTELRYLDDQPGTVGLATAVSESGAPLHIKIYGEDAANSQRAERVWRGLWYRTSGPAPAAGRIEQAQHEALALLAAAQADVDVPAVIGAGMTPDGDVLLVTGGTAPTTMASLDELDDDDLAATWTTMKALHRDARVSHGGLNQDNVHFTGDAADTVQLVNLDQASMFPTEQQLATDVVTMLALHATRVGTDRAVAGAVDAIGADDLELCLPYVQDAVLEPSVRKDLKNAGAKAKDLRNGLANALSVDEPELAAVRRVSVKDIVLAAAMIIAANALITQITDVGVDTIIEEFQKASKGWLVVTLLIKLISYNTAWFGMKALIEQPLPLFPTTLLQSAKSFVGLVVPSVVGRVGLDIRFLQNLGVPLAIASTQGPVISFIGFISEVLLLLLCAWAIGQSVESDDLGSFDGGGLLLLAIAVVVIGVIVILSVPKWRNMIVPVVKQAYDSIKKIVTSPKILGSIFFSETADRLLGALALGATVAAFGAQLSFAELVFVSVGTGLLAGLAPVPGGIGVAEATMTALLTAVGLPSEQAVAIAIIHRVMTAYIPPVIGFFSLRWLSREGYL